VSAAFAPLDFSAFHREELPRRLAAGHGAIAAQDELVALGGLAFRLPTGEAFTYQPRAGGVDVVAGDADAHTVIELAPELWSELAHDLESAPGLLYAGRVRCTRGDAMRFVRWEPGLRAMYHGRPIFSPRAPTCATPAGDRSTESQLSRSPTTAPRWRISCAARATCTLWACSRPKRRAASGTALASTRCARARATSARGGERTPRARRCCAASRAAPRSTSTCAGSRAIRASHRSPRSPITRSCRATAGATVSAC